MIWTCWTGNYCEGFDFWGVGVGNKIFDPWSFCFFLIFFFQAPLDQQKKKHYIFQGAYFALNHAGTKEYVIVKGSCVVLVPFNKPRFHGLFFGASCGQVMPQKSNPRDVLPKRLELKWSWWAKKRRPYPFVSWKFKLVTSGHKIWLKSSYTRTFLSCLPPSGKEETKL